MATIPVIRAVQNGITLYTGFAPAGLLRSIADVDVCDPLHDRPEGYQRPLEQNRSRQIAAYVKNSMGLLPNSILMNLRPDGIRHEYVPLPDNADIGMLHLDTTSPGARVWIVDGQHRLGAFVEAQDPGMQNVPLPAVFIEGFDRMKEANLFFVVNSKQKNVSPSLKYYDLMKFGNQELRNWLEGSESQWKVKASRLVTALNSDENSPWCGRINLTGARGAHKTINLVSFVTALRPMLEDRWFGTLHEQRQLDLIKGFWRGTSLVWPDVWDSERPKEALLQKSLGVFAMSMAALDVLHYCRRLNDFGVERMQWFISALRDHVEEWHTDSRLGTYGGMKGYKALGTELQQVIRDKALPELASAGVAEDA